MEFLAYRRTRANASMMVPDIYSAGIPGGGVAACNDSSKRGANQTRGELQPTQLTGIPGQCGSPKRKAGRRVLLGWFRVVSGVPFGRVSGAVCLGPVFRT